MSEMDKDRALERVRKMLALANDAGASEGERDNAMRMAHATLAKHNLSLVDVDASSGSEKRVDLGHETLCWPWMRVTANGIAELFFCKYFSVKTRKNYVKHYFVGRLSNATTASELSQYVIKSISKEAARAKSDEPFAGSDFVLSFCKGAAHKVYRRCAQLRADAERESQANPTIRATGTALVLASVYKQELDANSDYLRDVLKITLRTSVSRQRRASADAYNKGSAFGSSVSLNRQVGGSSGGQRQIAG